MEFKPDFESLRPYYEAFWNGEALDRVAVMATAPLNPGGQGGAGRWREPRFAATASAEENLDDFERWVAGVFFGGLAVPAWRPEFGPDVFSAFLGAELQYSAEAPGTSWSGWDRPLLPDYADLSRLAIRPESPVYGKWLALTTAAIERGAGRYLVSQTDLHAGFDSLAVLRGGPHVVATDILDHPEGVKAAMQLLWKVWKQVNDDYHAVIGGRQLGDCGWIGIWGPGRMYPVQNDFSCLLSNVQYREFLLEELLAEIAYLDYSIYHLDGFEALQHLDMLLDIPKLNAIQWVHGARFEAEGIGRWLPLYRCIQAKKKGILVHCRPKDVPLALAELKPEGLLLGVGCSTVEEAQAVLKLCGWPA